MSAHVNDFASAVAVHAAVPPSVQGAAFAGGAIDLIDSDGECFAVQQVGTFEEGNTWAGRVEQSADGSTGWTAIAGAAFAPVTEGNDTQVIRFTRTPGTCGTRPAVTGSTADLILAVLVGEARKAF
jgi:hypothetical protein